MFNWLKSRVSAGRRAGWLYRRGMRQAKLQNNEAAIIDYTAVVEMPDVSGDMRAMALFNRALVYHATGNDAQAVRDLKRILEMMDAASDVKTEARRKLVRMERASNRNDGPEPIDEPHAHGGTQARPTSKASGKRTHQQ